MTFATTLNDYCDSLRCTNKELAARCNISDSAISRYRKGERTPEVGGSCILKLSQGIADLFAERDTSDPPNAESVQHLLEDSILKERRQGLNLCTRTNELLSMLNIRNAELASTLRIDPSYISRIRSCQRIPADQQSFARNCARFVAEKCRATNQREKVAMLIGNQEAPPENLAKAIESWLLGQDLEF